MEVVPQSQVVVPPGESLVLYVESLVTSTRNHVIWRRGNATLTQYLAEDPFCHLHSEVSLLLPHSQCRGCACCVHTLAHQCGVCCMSPAVSTGVLRALCECQELQIITHVHVHVYTCTYCTCTPPHLVLSCCGGLVLFLSPQPEVCNAAMDTHPNASFLRRQRTRPYLTTRREPFSSCSSRNKNVNRLFIYLIVDNVVASDAGNYTFNITSIFVPRGRRTALVDVQVEVSTRGTCTLYCNVLYMYMYTALYFLAYLVYVHVHTCVSSMVRPTHACSQASLLLWNCSISTKTYMYMYRDVCSCMPSPRLFVSPLHLPLTTECENDPPSQVSCSNSSISI